MALDQAHDMPRRHCNAGRCEEARTCIRVMCRSQYMPLNGPEDAELPTLCQQDSSSA